MTDGPHRHSCGKVARPLGKPVGGVAGLGPFGPGPGPV